ncbi:hypothetical protein [Mesorhizobium sp. B2-1-2]|uniref:hypothetical protein n=1 Tax=Mesorhizobium sp. B2-1-2 TaxID=2589973 RepID=UPI00112D23EA|nr:hypothetical protein [Mesorhizobium sp. B2-1-2]TPN11726.1 hypothetical protein FJ971_09990 [Mesorhizobium sp. B2-1-2]
MSFWRGELIKVLSRLKEVQAGLGTAAAKNTGTSGNTIPLLDGANTWSAAQTFSARPSLAGGGASFPATAIPSAGANVLDDYEEGAWTPTLTFGGASVGITYTTRQGRYTKIGNQVTIWVYIKLSSKGSSTGNAIITGAPFTALSNMSFYAGTVGFYSGTTSVINAGTAIPAATSVINLYNLPAGVWNDTNVGNTTDIILSICYEAA